MKLCLNRGTAGGGLPLPEFVQLAKTAGFDGADVDLSYAVEKSPAALRELYESINMTFGGWGPFDWRGAEAKFNEGLAAFGKSAKIASDLKIDSCATWLLPSSDLPLMENFHLHVTRLKPVAKILADHGLRLGLEFVAPNHLRKKWKHEFLFTPGQMLELADAIGDNVGLLVDCFHCLCSGTPSREIAHLPASKIVLVHFNDAPEEPIEDQQDFKRLLPGEGVIDLPGFLAALEHTGYTGPVSIEVFNEDLKKLPAMKAAKRACEAGRKFAPFDR